MLHLHWTLSHPICYKEFKMSTSYHGISMSACKSKVFLGLYFGDIVYVFSNDTGILLLVHWLIHHCLAVCCVHSRAIDLKSSSIWKENPLPRRVCSLQMSMEGCQQSGVTVPNISFTQLQYVLYGKYWCSHILCLNRWRLYTHDYQPWASNRGPTGSVLLFVCAFIWISCLAEMMWLACIVFTPITNECVITQISWNMWTGWWHTAFGAAITWPNISEIMTKSFLLSLLSGFRSSVVPYSGITNPCNFLCCHSFNFFCP